MNGTSSNLTIWPKRPYIRRPYNRNWLYSQCPGQTNKVPNLTDIDIQRASIICLKLRGLLLLTWLKLWIMANFWWELEIIRGPLKPGKKGKCSGFSLYPHLTRYVAWIMTRGSWRMHLIESDIHQVGKLIHFSLEIFKSCTTCLW